MASTKCLGILGRMFGHKFKHSTFEYDRYFDHCQRCGMPKGGWKQ